MEKKYKRRIIINIEATSEINVDFDKIMASITMYGGKLREFSIKC